MVTIIISSSSGGVGGMGIDICELSSETKHCATATSVCHSPSLYHIFTIPLWCKYRRTLFPNFAMTCMIYFPLCVCVCRKCVTPN